VRREDLPGGGIRLGLTVPERPALRAEIAGPARFLISQNGQPVLLARVARDHGGVQYVRRAGLAPVLPPIPASTLPSSWPHRYASWLVQGPGPLHAGWWSLRAWRPRPMIWEREVADADSGFLDWWTWEGVLTTRPLPAAGDGRVKAYRKRIAGGGLPPLLVWWVSGLDSRVLLDGHARLAAALAEGVSPPALELARAPSPAAVAERIGQFCWDGPAGRERRLSRVAAEIPGDRERTRAWPLPGGLAAWRAAAPRGWPGPAAP
jgi:hypothetical protein